MIFWQWLAQVAVMRKLPQQDDAGHVSLARVNFRVRIRASGINPGDLKNVDGLERLFLQVLELTTGRYPAAALQERPADGDQAWFQP